MREEEDEVSPEVEEKKRIYRLRLTQPLYGASPLDAWARFFFKYGQFAGRASRSEYWYSSMCLSGYLLVCACAYALFFEDPSILGAILLIAVFIGILVIIVPSLSLTARRYHDAGLSALWMLIGSLISLAGILIAGTALLDATKLMFELHSLVKDAAPAGAGGAPQSPATQNAAFLALPLSSAKELLSMSIKAEEEILGVGVLILIPGQIIDIIFCLLPSSQKGVRFDVPRLPFEWTVTKESYLNSKKREKLSESCRQG
ncbi:MAG: DUF805 domain-containing protein [Aeriscardovia sp.]|nr:DUF805 domain-containing protein [Aeriscardovia sp.]